MGYVRVTRISSYVESSGQDSRRVTRLSGYVETSPGVYARVTREGALVELTPDQNARISQIFAQVELNPGSVVRVTAVRAYVELIPDASHTLPTTTPPSADNLPKVANIVGIIGLQNKWSLLSQMVIYAELVDKHLYATKYVNVVEMSRDDLRITKFVNVIELEYEEPPPEMPTYFPESAGTRAMHTKLPEEVIGYAFDPEHSWWSTIVPEESTNLIINPSFEKWNDLGNILEYDWGGTLGVHGFVEFPLPGATAGRRCAKMTSAGSSGWLEYEETPLVNPGTYTFSFDFYTTRTPLAINIAIVNGGSGVASKKIIIDKTGWHRYHLTYSEISSGVRGLRVTVLNTNPSGIICYTDAWQFEAKPYPTTYLDGDMVSTTDVRPFQSYFWHGTPHASISTRRASANNGGRPVSWRDHVGFQTTNLIGLQMSPTELKTQMMASGREIHKGVNSLPRDFSITGRIYAENYSQLKSKHIALVELLKPNKAIRSPQTILRYHRTDSNGRHVGAPMDIICMYRDGLQGTINGFYQETLPLQFHASDPSWMDVIENSTPLTLRKALWANGIFYRDEIGEYHNLGVGDSDAPAKHVGFLADGSPVIAGQFENFAGYGVENVAMWNGEEWVQLGTFTASTINAIDTGYDTGYNMVIANGDHVLEYSSLSNSWSQLGDEFDDEIQCLKRDVNGDIWIGGLFDYAIDGITRYRHIAKWDYDDEAWEPVGGGVGDPYDVFPEPTSVTSVLPMNDGNVYFAGLFGDAFATLDPFPLEVLAKGVARWNVDTGAWYKVGEGLYGEVTQLLRGKDGYIYAVGDFETDAGLNPVTMRGFARYTGYQWEEVFYLKRVNGDIGADGAAVDENGIVWFFGETSASDEYFDVSTSIGPVEFFGYRDGVFYPPFAQRTYGANDMAIGPGNRMLFSTLRYIDDDETTQTMYVPALNSVNYGGNMDAPIAIHLEGPLRPAFIDNLTMEGGAYFKPTLELGENEHMTLRTDSQRTISYSNVRPNLQKFTMPGLSSMASLQLLPGLNRISVYCLDPVDSSALGWLIWKNRFWGNDGGG